MVFKHFSFLNKYNQIRFGRRRDSSLIIRNDDQVLYSCWHDDTFFFFFFFLYVCLCVCHFVFMSWSCTFLSLVLPPTPPSIHPSLPLSLYPAQHTEGGCSLFSVFLWILPPPWVWHPQRWPNLGWPLGSGVRRLCEASTVALASVLFPLEKR